MLTSLSSDNYKNKFILRYNKQAVTIIGLVKTWISMRKNEDK